MWKRTKNFFRSLFRKDGRIYHPTAPKPPVPDFTSSNHLLHYPRAAQTNKMPTQGKFRAGYPEGVVIHFTAGRDNHLNTRNYMASKKLVALIVDKDGHVWQDFPLNRWGWHAGKSSWKGFRGSLNDDFVGIEVICGGKLKPKGNRYLTWFGTAISNFRIGPALHNCKVGCYEKFTAAQETELVELVVWLIKNSHGKMSVENIVGHDEIAPNRKNDPGWALSMTMPAFRRVISAKLKEASDCEQVVTGTE